MAKAYGFAGAANVGVVRRTAVGSPGDAHFALAQGAIGGSLPWKMIGMARSLRRPLLLDTTLADEETAHSAGCWLELSPDVSDLRCVVGAVTQWYDKRTRSMANPDRAERLARCGVGIDCRRELVGVINAGLIVGFRRSLWDRTHDLRRPLAGTARLRGLARLVVRVELRRSAAAR